MRDDHVVSIERGLIGDLKWALGVMVGVAAAVLILGADASLVAASAIGVLLVVAVRAMLRYRRRPSSR